MKEAGFESLLLNRTPSCQPSVLLAWHNGSGKSLSFLNIRPVCCQLGNSIELETHSSPATIHFQGEAEK